MVYLCIYIRFPHHQAYELKKIQIDALDPEIQTK